MRSTTRGARYCSKRNRRPDEIRCLDTETTEPASSAGAAARPGARRKGWTGRSKSVVFQYCLISTFAAERVLSFQITVLKVLAGVPDGSASVAELTRYVSVLMSSGSDWSDRMRVLAARAPNLDIFSNKLVLRSELGWQITESGREFLSLLQAPVREEPREDRSIESNAAMVEREPVRSALRLVVDNTLGAKSEPGPDETRRSA